LKNRKFPIGTCKFVSNAQQYDLSIINGNEIEVIAMEFKLQKASLTVPNLKTIFDKLRDNCSASIAFVVSLDLVGSIDNDVSWKNIKPNNYIYSVIPKDTKGNKLTLVRHFPINEPSDASFEMNTDTDVEMSITDSNQGSRDENDGRFQKEPEPERIKPHVNPNRDLILILISIVDLNRIGSTEKFLRKIPMFKKSL